MKLYFYAFCVISILALVGCGGNNSGDISVTVTPSTVSVALSGTQQFTAKVKGTSNANVTWEVDGVVGGDATHGKISSTGLYTAPDTVPSPATVTITAISIADTNKTAQAAVVVGKPVSVTPDTASVAASSTQQFTATVNFSTNKDVTWQVNGVAGGNSTLGTIDSKGLYTAPSSVPNPSTVTITAVSSADSGRTGTASVTVTAPPILVSPSTAVVGAGAQQVYTATVLTKAVQPVWSVACASTITDVCGTISSDGKYTAPSAPPPNAVVTITARMADQSAAAARVTATIQFGNATLAGTYIFAIGDRIGQTAPFQVGALVFDGAGHISGGVVDSTDAPGTPFAVTGGTYQAGADGRGTATVQTTNGSMSLQFVLAGRTKAFVVRTDANGSQASGTMELQQIASGAQSPNGSYALAVSGRTSGASPVTWAEAGSLAVGGAGTITGGVVDVNQGSGLQTTSVIGGVVTPPQDSFRGTVAIVTGAGTQTFAWYPIDSQHAKVIPIDGSLAGNGDLFAQPSGPFTAATLKRGYVFSVGGTKNASRFGVAGKFALDGTGTVANLVFDGIAQTVFDSDSGAYTVTDAQTGRTTATWTGDGGTRLQYVLYPRSDGGMVVLQSDANYVGMGEAFPRAENWSDGLSSPNDGYALLLSGSEVSSPTVPLTVSGQMLFSSTSALSGTVDGIVKGQGTPLMLNVLDQDLNAQRYTLGFSSTGLTGGSTVLYRIDENRAFLIESDSTRNLTGMLQRQY